MQRLDRCFITGCDKNTEWTLKWFLKNYYKHNNVPIVFVDFGVSDKIKSWIKGNFAAYIDLTTYDSWAWFRKPQAILETNSHKKVWLDTDCEVVGNIEGIFDYLKFDMLSMVEDKPWTKRRGETWHNSGVVGVIGNPEILRKWANACKTNPIIGDQEVLHSMLDPLTRKIFINDLPNKYNYLRLQSLDGDDKSGTLIYHWTGNKGKEYIRSKI